MYPHDISRWTHSHIFDAGNPAAERGTYLVMNITAIMMAIEVVAGLWYNSMALLADGWNMSSHALAMGLSVFAYAAARRYADDKRFAFGTWKIEVLAGFASAIFLLGISVFMAFGSVERLLNQQEIRYEEAMVVTIIGLLVNIGCALILGDAHVCGHEKNCHNHHSHHDLNLRSAYLHVMADAATSVLGILALAGGWLLGWPWLDPIMGLVGAALVGVWALGLLRQTGTILLDREMDHCVVNEIREAIGKLEEGRDKIYITDLHVWRVGKEKFACLLSLVMHSTTMTPDVVKHALSIHDELVHVTVEIHRFAH
jgi:cation diffusion facilitator family transporter